MLQNELTRGLLGQVAESGMCHPDTSSIDLAKISAISDQNTFYGSYQADKYTTPTGLNIVRPIIIVSYVLHKKHIRYSDNLCWNVCNYLELPNAELQG